MNKKDIALTVGGVVATMVLAYLLYLRQKQDAANAAANAAANQDAQAAQSAQEYQYSSQLPSIGVSSPTSLSTSNEGSSDTTASSGTSADAATEGLLTSIIADFAGSINQTQPGSGSNASLIPTLPNNSDISLTSVPTTPSGYLDNHVGIVPAVSPATGVATAHPIVGEAQ